MAVILSVAGAIVTIPSGIDVAPPTPEPMSDDERALRDAGFAVLN